MVHSVKKRKQREKAKMTLKKRIERLSKLGAREEQKVVEEPKIVEMVLPYVALGDLRRRWRQRETPLDPYLHEKVKKFKRVRILKYRPIHICGSEWRIAGIWSCFE